VLALKAEKDKNKKGKQAVREVLDQQLQQQHQEQLALISEQKEWDKRIIRKCQQELEAEKKDKLTRIEAVRREKQRRDEVMKESQDYKYK